MMSKWEENSEISPSVLTCPARSRMGISSDAILQFSLVTSVIAAPDRLESDYN